MTMRKRTLLASVAAVSALMFSPLLASGSAFAWEPTEDIEITIHTGSDSSTYLFTRAIADELAEKTGVQVNISSMTGARGDRARRHVQVRNAGNPYSMQTVTPSQVSQAVQMDSDVRGSGFTPLALLAVTPNIVAVRADSPYHTMDDLFNDARDRPGEILHGSGSYGTVSTLHHRMIEEEYDLQMTLVPNDDVNRAIIDLLGGHVHFVMQNPEQVLDYVEAGDLRVIGASAPLDILPDVQTYEEQGYTFQVMEQYRGLWAPPELPQEAVDYYISVLTEIAESDDFRNDYIAANNLVPMLVTGDDMADMIAAEEEVYERLYREFGLME